MTLDVGMHVTEDTKVEVKVFEDRVNHRQRFVAVDVTDEHNSEITFYFSERRPGALRVAREIVSATTEAIDALTTWMEEDA